MSQLQQLSWVLDDGIDITIQCNVFLLFVPAVSQGSCIITALTAMLWILKYQKLALEGDLQTPHTYLVFSAVIVS